jgi:hypothetical protein
MSASLHLIDSSAAPAPAVPPAGPALAARKAAWGAAALACLLGFALLLLHASAEQRALQTLPAAERAALYHRTMETLTSLCAAEGKRDLRDLCRGQAQLALLLPECDGACQATAREQLRTPTR